MNLKPESIVLATINKNGDVLVPGTIEFYQEKINQLNTMIDNNENILDCLYERAMCNYQYGKFSEVIEDVNTLISSNPSDYRYYHIKANTLDELGNYNEAMKYYDKAISLNTNDGTVYYDKGWCYSNRFKNYDSASKCYELSVQNGYRNAKSFKSLGISYMSIGSYQKAIDSFEEANKLLHESMFREIEGVKIPIPTDRTEIISDYEDITINLAICNDSLGNTEKAIEYLSLIIENNSNCADAIWNRALYYKKIDLYDKAKTDLIEYSKLNNITYHDKTMALELLDSVNDLSKDGDKGEKTISKVEIASVGKEINGFTDNFESKSDNNEKVIGGNDRSVEKKSPQQSKPEPVQKLKRHVGGAVFCLVLAFLGLFVPIVGWSWTPFFGIIGLILLFKKY